MLWVQIGRHNPREPGYSKERLLCAITWVIEQAAPPASSPPPASRLPPPASRLPPPASLACARPSPAISSSLQLAPPPPPHPRRHALLRARPDALCSDAPPRPCRRTNGQALYESASPNKQLVLLIDLRGFGMRNFDKFFIEHAFRHLLANHPQRMGLCLMLNAPTVFNAAWAVRSRRARLRALSRR